MSLTVTLTNRMTEEPVAYRAIQIKIWNPPGDDLEVITDENGQFTIDEKYRNINFILRPKYIESGENTRDLHLGGWKNWESDTLNIPTMLSSGVEPRSLGAGITVALKIPRIIMVHDDSRHLRPLDIDQVRDYFERYGRGHEIRVNIPNPMEIAIQLMDPWDDLEVTTDRNGLFLIDEKYRNLECCISNHQYGFRSGWVKLDNNYVEIALKIVSLETVSSKWLR